MHEALIVACSKRKRDTAGPAILVYNGPLHQILRKNLPKVDLFFLSALHGLIAADKRIEPYDVSLKDTALTTPQLGSQWLDLGLNSYINLFTCMPQDYTLLLSKVTPEYSSRNTIFRIGESGMGIGQLGQVLHAWSMTKRGDMPRWAGVCLA